MKHFKHLWMLLAAMLLSINVWGYEIVFTTGSNDGTSVSTSTTASSVVTTASASYVTGNLATATKAYSAGSKGFKLGASSNAGTLKINLSEAGQVNASSIDVYACYYNSSKQPTLKVNGSATQTVSTADATKYSFSVSGNLTYIQLDVNKYCWIEKVVVNTTSSSDQTTV